MIARASLFAQLAGLLALALAVYTLLAWTIAARAVIQPTGAIVGTALAERTRAAERALAAGTSLPPGSRLRESGAPPQPAALGSMSFYASAVAATLRATLGPAATVVVTRIAGPAEVHVRTPRTGARWIVLDWEVAGSDAPWALLLLLGLVALFVLAAASMAARRITRPLATLAAAAEGVAAGRLPAADLVRGPLEVRDLGSAIAAMSARLQAANRDRELMLAGISHDVRTPLARLSVSLELLRGGDTRVVDSMQMDIDDVDRTMNQFLEFTRAGFVEPPASVVLDELVREAVRGRFEPAGLRLDLNAPLPAFLPRRSVQRVLLNLLENARRHGRPPITVRTRQSAGPAAAAELSVADHGVGMDSTQFWKACEPFAAPLEATRPERVQLGLATVARLVVASGAELTAARTDAGFVVAVRWPSAAAPIADDPPGPTGA